METFERIAKALEGIESALQILASKQPGLIQQYGKYVDKTVAAQILGVTRATVYAMINDGRIRGAYGGRKVDVRSIAAYMENSDDHAKEAVKGGDAP